MKFHLRVYDNFHYGDESEAYNYGEYSTYAAATIGAQEIVKEFLEHNWKIGISPKELFTQFCLYGEEPVILPNEHGDHTIFSARTYAKDIVKTICKNLKKTEQKRKN